MEGFVFLVYRNIKIRKSFRVPSTEKLSVDQLLFFLHIFLAKTPFPIGHPPLLGGFKLSEARH